MPSKSRSRSGTGCHAEGHCEIPWQPCSEHHRARFLRLQKPSANSHSRPLASYCSGRRRAGSYFRYSRPLADACFSLWQDLRPRWARDCGAPVPPRMVVEDLLVDDDAVGVERFGLISRLAGLRVADFLLHQHSASRPAHGTWFSALWRCCTRRGTCAGSHCSLKSVFAKPLDRGWPP